MTFDKPQLDQAERSEYKDHFGLTPIELSRLIEKSESRTVVIEDLHEVIIKPKPPATGG